MYRIIITNLKSLKYYNLLLIPDFRETLAAGKDMKDIAGKVKSVYLKL